MAIQTQAESASRIYQWPEQGQWTYEAYTRLPNDGRRYEVIGGELYMAPAPSTKHQIVSFELAFALYTHIKANNLGQVLEAPIDLILPDQANPVQPDILFVTRNRLDILQEKYVEGVPDLIVEILSPGNPHHDRRTKYDLYAAAGVQEYWIVDPDSCIVDIYTLHADNIYVPYGHFEPGGMIQSNLLPELRISVEEICES